MLSFGEEGYGLGSHEKGKELRWRAVQVSVDMTFPPGFLLYLCAVLEPDLTWIKPPSPWIDTWYTWALWYTK